MTDREKVAWLRVLLFIWGLVFLPMFLLAIGAPTSVQAAGKIAGWALLVWGVLTALYLLILSWRAAFLSGRSRR